VNYYIIIFIVWQEGRKKKMEISCRGTIHVGQLKKEKG